MRMGRRSGRGHGAISVAKKAFLLSMLGGNINWLESEYLLEGCKMNVVSIMDTTMFRAVGRELVKPGDEGRKLSVIPTIIAGLEGAPKLIDSVVIKGVTGCALSSDAALANAAFDALSRIYNDDKLSQITSDSTWRGIVDDAVNATEYFVLGSSDVAAIQRALKVSEIIVPKACGEQLDRIISIVHKLQDGDCQLPLAGSDREKIHPQISRTLTAIAGLSNEWAVSAFRGAEIIDHFIVCAAKPPERSIDPRPVYIHGMHASPP